MPAPVIDSPRTRSMNSWPSPVKSAGRGSSSSTFSWASTSVPAATSPTSGMWRVGRSSAAGVVEPGSDLTSMARGLVGVAPEVAEALEAGQVGVDGGRGREPHRLADLAHRRRVAAVAGVGDDAVEDPLLALGEFGIGHACSFRRDEVGRSAWCPADEVGAAERVFVSL